MKNLLIFILFLFQACSQSEDSVYLNFKYEEKSGYKNLLVVWHDLGMIDRGNYVSDQQNDLFSIFSDKNGLAGSVTIIKSRNEVHIELVPDSARELSPAFVFANSFCKAVSVSKFNIGINNSELNVKDKIIYAPFCR